MTVSLRYLDAKKRSRRDVNPATPREGLESRKVPISIPSQVQPATAEATDFCCAGLALDTRCKALPRSNAPVCVGVSCAVAVPQSYDKGPTCGLSSTILDLDVFLTVKVRTPPHKQAAAAQTARPQRLACDEA